MASSWSGEAVGLVAPEGPSELPRPMRGASSNPPHSSHQQKASNDTVHKLCSGGQGPATEGLTAGCRASGPGDGKRVGAALPGLPSRIGTCDRPQTQVSAAAVPRRGLSSAAAGRVTRNWPSRGRAAAVGRSTEASWAALRPRSSVQGQRLSALVIVSPSEFALRLQRAQSPRVVVLPFIFLPRRETSASTLVHLGCALDGMSRLGVPK